MCVPWDSYTLGSVPFRCSKYLSLMQPRAVADPSAGLRNPPQCLSHSANIWSRQQPEINHPFRQKYLLKGWLCARLNLFKEFTVIETCGGGDFFPSGMESSLLKHHLLVTHRAPHLSACFLGAVQTKQGFAAWNITHPSTCCCCCPIYCFLPHGIGRGLLIRVWLSTELLDF